MNTSTESLARPSVHVVDDDDSFRVSMTRLLGVAGLHAIGYRCAGEFLLADADKAPGCILLDISMPGPSGVELLKALVSRNSAPPVIFVTGRDEVFTSVEVMRTGAIDYIVKPVSAERILPAVRKAIQLDAERRAARRELSEFRSRFATLTAAESAVFRGVVHNKLNKQLAAELGSCERTIKAQRARMMEKLQITSLPDLVRGARLLEVANTEGEEQRRNPVSGIGQTHTSSASRLASRARGGRSTLHSDACSEARGVRRSADSAGKSAGALRAR